jgi:hypothetical protein
MKRGTTAAYCDLGSLAGPEVEVPSATVSMSDAAEADAELFCSELRDGVRSDRIEPTPPCAARPIPVDGRRRREDHATHPLVPRGKKDVEVPRR